MIRWVFGGQKYNDIGCHKGGGPAAGHVLAGLGLVADEVGDGVDVGDGGVADGHQVEEVLDGLGVEVQLPPGGRPGGGGVRA